MVYITREEMTELFKTAEIKVLNIRKYLGETVYGIHLSDGSKIIAKFTNILIDDLFFENSCIGEFFMEIGGKKSPDFCLFVMKGFGDTKMIEFVKKAALIKLDYLNKEERK